MPAKPPRLEPGDAIAVIAPASAPPDPATIDSSVCTLEHLGYKPRLAPNVRRRWGFLAGSDRERADDLMRMFADTQVKAVLCVRGGYGTARLLPLLDFNVIRSNPKIFVGYSDITSLHCAFLLKAGLISFHGPMLNSDLVKPNLPAPTLRSLIRTLSERRAPGSICQGFSRHSVRVLSPGIASGRLLGGNLTILCAALGTPYLPSFQGKILFFEDVDEVPYRFDRLLTQLLNAGLLQQAAGIAIGMNARCRDPKARKSTEYRQTLEEVFAERLLPLGIPVVLGLPFGHTRLNATLPIGCRATLDAYKGDLIITEPSVS